MRVVLDTNTIVSALLWGGVPDQLLAAATEARIELFTSPPLLAELADVLAREKFSARVGKAGRTAHQLVEQYRGLAESVEPAMIRSGSVPDRKMWRELADAEARHGKHDPVEGRAQKTAGPAQTLLRNLLRG